MKLNIEQRKIIENKPNGHALVKGVAGSGKTTVAVHKIPILLNNYCKANEDKILMVTYNKSLSNYVKYIYEEIKEFNTQNKISFDLYTVDSEDKLEIKTIDSILFRYFSIYKKQNNIKLDIASQQQQNNALTEAIVKTSESYSDVKLINTKNLNFIKEEITWIKACNYMEIEEYQTIDRIGRTTSNNNADSPQKLRKNSRVREAIFETMLMYNKNLRNKNLIDFQDMAFIAMEQANKYVEKKYTHIIIDESQDLTKMQIEFLKKIYRNKPYSCLLFVADTAQSIYPQAWLVKGRSFASIGFDMTGKSNSLSKNYRTTTQIAQAAYSLIEKDKNIVEDDNFVKPSLIDRQGEYPVYRCFDDKEKETDFLINTIEKELKEKYDYKDIAIIARQKNQLNEIKSYLEKDNIPFKELYNKEEMDFKDNSIKLLTMHAIKGLEFKVVMIAGLNNKCIPSKTLESEFDDGDMSESRDRKLLYVGMTRATEKLFLTSDGMPSKFIKDIDYNYMRISSDSHFRRFHKVDIKNYEFKDKINDLYHDEEVTRQWIINELVNTYKYPKDLIDIEYKVNIGSKFGLADIVIYNYGTNKEKIPYIFIETKQWGMGLDSATSQLKSYMSNNKVVKYGISTDGNEISIINDNFEEIGDIPMFNIHMLPESTEMLEYIDIKHGISYDFIRDSSNEREITVDNSEVEIEVIGIPVFNEISAGEPIFMNDELQGMFYLPKECINSPNESFVLKIKGDSMRKANMDNGDHVVIRKQSSANNGDIVAADIDGNATLKKIMMMGSNVLLIAENDDYEPIMLPADEVRIIGCAVGIIKSKR